MCNSVHDTVHPSIFPDLTQAVWEIFAVASSLCSSFYPSTTLLLCFLRLGLILGRLFLRRDLSFFFDLKSIRQRDLRSQAIAVPSAGGPGAVAQISAALELVGWSVSHPPAPVTKWQERIWNGPLDAGYTNVRIIIELT